MALSACAFIEALACASFAQQSPAPVTVARPVVKTIMKDFAHRQRWLCARVSGFLDQVHVSDGNLVEMGQLPFTINQRRFRPALRQAQAQISIAEATCDFSTERLERAQTLIGNGSVIQSVLDQRREASAPRDSL